MIYRFTDHERVEVEEREGGPKRIVGYAARFYNGQEGTQYELAPGIVERIMPGAFASALQRGDDTRALFNHDPNLLLGRTKSGTLELEETTRGLRYRVQPPDTQIGRDVLHSIERGDITGSSFAFTIDEESWRTEGVGQSKVEVREIRSVRLYDVSPVTYPAYEATSVGLRFNQPADDWQRSYDRWRNERKAEVEAELATYRARATVAGLEVK